MLDLTSDQVADAETVGVSFPAATPQQVQRLSMHLKVFRVGGEPVLATRDGALFETAATLGRLIVEGGRQRRDLAAWQAAVPAPEAKAPSLPSPLRSAEKPRPKPPVVSPPPMPVAAARLKGRAAPRGERWRTAGAERRGRLAEHWSRRGER